MTANRLVPLARKLRAESTPAEAKLWSVLRNKQLEGYKFRRQHPVGNYVADFCCEEIGLIIELDGGQHAERENRDRIRTLVLEDMKYTVLRFWNIDIIEALDGVVDRILEIAHAARATFPFPLGEGGARANAREDEGTRYLNDTSDPLTRPPFGGRPLPRER
ncbi:MAG: endonuclease domain-containing protein [Aestuariivirga sp.]